MSIIGKKFEKKEQVVVVDVSGNHVHYQNVNNQSENFTLTKEAFEANYVEVVNKEETNKTNEKDGGDMTVSNKEKNNTKEEK